MVGGHTERITVAGMRGVKHLVSMVGQLRKQPSEEQVSQRRWADTQKNQDATASTRPGTTSAHIGRVTAWQSLGPGQAFEVTKRLQVLRHIWSRLPVNDCHTHTPLIDTATTSRKSKM